jgi:hypothetical protein
MEGLRKMPRNGQRAASILERLFVTLHLMMAWVLFICTLSVIFGLLIQVIRYTGTHFVTLQQRPGTAGVVVVLILGLPVFGLLVYASLIVFLHGWFFYLKHVVGANRREVERRLPLWINMAALEPAYSNVRRRFFAE